MRTTFLSIYFFITFGLLVASCEAGRINTELARMGVAECGVHDCWE